jgi:hypothetical protein
MYKSEGVKYFDLDDSREVKEPDEDDGCGQRRCPLPDPFPE